MKDKNKNNTSAKLSAGTLAKLSAGTLAKLNAELVPHFRFPEFQNSEPWEVKRLVEVLIKNTKKNTDGQIKLVESVSNKYGFVKQDEYFEDRIVASKDLKNYYVIEKGVFAYNPSRIDVGSLAYKDNDTTSVVSPLYVTFRANKLYVNDYFLLHWFSTYEFISQMKFFLEGGVRNTLSYENLSLIEIPLPTLPEQEKIAACLTSLDELITAEKEKLELLKQHKKGLLQNLFPKEGETVPKLRFPEFQNSKPWQVKKLGEVLSYERPDKFIVETENYSKEGIPVLTANKSFILGYTNETEGIYTKLPAIIFDDFTTDKKYVDFLFKVKSSAIKILHPIGDNNLKFIFEIMSQIRFEAKEHKRYYISTYQNLQIPLPSLHEQQKIADCLSSLDDLISAQRQKIEALELHKKGLLQNLFPNTVQTQCIASPLHTNNQ